MYVTMYESFICSGGSCGSCGCMGDREMLNGGGECWCIGGEECS